MYEPLQAVLDERAEHSLGTDLHPERTGWERVDDQLVQLRDRHASAATVEDYQAIGLLCRDLMVSLAEACYDAARHGVAEGLVERLLAVVRDEAAGGSNQQLRAVFRSAIDLANKVQHDRRASRRSANVVAETTSAVVNLMRILVIDPN